MFLDLLNTPCIFISFPELSIWKYLSLYPYWGLQLPYLILLRLKITAWRQNWTCDLLTQKVNLQRSPSPGKIKQPLLTKRIKQLNRCIKILEIIEQIKIGIAVWFKSNTKRKLIKCRFKIVVVSIDKNRRANNLYMWDL